MSDHGATLIQLLGEFFIACADGRGPLALVVRWLVTIFIAVAALYFCVIFWRATFG